MYRLTLAFSWKLCVICLIVTSGNLTGNPLAYAATAGTFCPPVEDTRFDAGAAIIYIAPSLCGSEAQASPPPENPPNNFLTLLIWLNSRNTNSPTVTVNNFAISYETSIINNVTVNGSNFASGTNLNLTSATVFVVEFQEEGNTFHFTVTANPVTHTLSGFTLMAGAAPGTNTAPIAEAGPAQVVVSGTQVTLDGTGSSDSDGTIASYAWTRTGGSGTAGNAILSSATASQPTFTDSSLTSNDTVVTHVFSLVVTDDDGATSSADSVTITINPPTNAAPIAEAGPAQVVVSGTQVTLDGTGSSDSDGTIVSYAWTRVGGTGTAATLNDATASQPTFTESSLTSNDIAVSYVFSLVVTDDDGATSSADSVSFIINAPTDATPPTATITTPSGSHNGSTPFVATVTFNEAVTGFVDGELTASNATVGPLSPAGGSGTVFTASITPAGPLDVVLSVAANVAQDLANNYNTAASDITVTGTVVEQTQQVINSFMSNRANHILGNQPNLISFVDRTNTNGGGPLGVLGVNANEESMVLAFSTSRSKILATQEKNRIINAFAAEDELSDNLNAINEQTAINGEEIGASGYGQDDSLSSGLGRAGTWDIWTEVYGSRRNADTSDSSLWVGYLGFHTFATDHMLVGVLGQMDWADETNSAVNSKADGNGWMVGPYIAGKVPDQNVYYEARASWGRSTNNVSAIGTYTDSFDTTRLLASAKVSGAHVVGELTIRPEARVSWFEETQESYTDSLTNLIPEQTISLGEINFGPTLSRSITLDDGTQVKPSIGFSGVWNFGIQENAASQGFALGNDDLRARLDVGLSTTNTLGWMLELAGYYDGIGINDYDAYGGSVKIVVPLH